MTNRLRFIQLTLATGITCLPYLLATAQPNPAPLANINPQTSDVHFLMTQYSADRGSLNRFYTVENSPERRERFQKLNTDFLKQLEKMNFNQLSVDSQVDYVLFQRTIQVDQRELAEEAAEVEKIKAWFPFADKFYALEKLRRRGTTMNGEQVARDLTQWGRDIAEARKAAEKLEKIDPALAQRAEGTANGLRAALKSVYEFYNNYDPQFTWWVPEPYRKTDSLLAGYAALFAKKAKVPPPVKEDGSGIVGVAVGRDALLQQLAFEYIPYSPEELIEIANKEFAWCDRELLKASREMGFGDNWKAAQEKVKNSIVPVGK
jgi:hypothetical protein